MTDPWEEETAIVTQALEDAGAVRCSEKHGYLVDCHDADSRGRAIASLTKQFGRDLTETLVDQVLSSLPTRSPGGD
ncbi:MAG: hypothetical protein EON59_00465 [Alphaproteobacteria bacterium]|nr:MAG: hypothetical protein EON59_00465 [Alphaproteobacteria bacterium]